jgi:chemotaxis protein methyltransferase WspC
MDAIPVTALERILWLLQQHLGSDPRSCGVRMLEQAIRTRQQARRCVSIEAYEYVLKQDEQERQALVEEVIVPETWFFRDGLPFQALKRHLSRAGWPWSRGDVLRVLSIPSSTGEEPYSIAITLYEAGLRCQHFKVIGERGRQSALAGAGDSRRVRFLFVPRARAGIHRAAGPILAQERPDLAGDQ